MNTPTPIEVLDVIELGAPTLCAVVVLFPSIVSDDNATPRGLVADNTMAHGHYFAAEQLRKQGMCFSLAYFLMFGRAPRISHIVRG